MEENPFEETEQTTAQESTATQNTNERERAFELSTLEFNLRSENKTKLPPTDTEKRIGAFKEMLEPQVRDAICTLVERGYVTIDSGYDPRRIADGVQYIGFKKDMINEQVVALVSTAVAEKMIEASLESDERSDYLLLKPSAFMTLEEWREIWNTAVAVFPDRGAPAPMRERFIEKIGH